MPSTSITIQFGDADAVDEEGNIVQTIKAELDASRNPEGRTTFPWGSTAYFKTFRVPSNLAIEMFSSHGTLNTFIATGTDTVTEEAIQFSMSDSASPAKPIVSGSFSSIWSGMAPAPQISPSANGNSVVLNRPSLGYVIASYQSRYDVHAITVPEMDQPIAVIVYIRSVE